MQVPGVFLVGHNCFMEQATKVCANVADAEHAHSLVPRQQVPITAQVVLGFVAAKHQHSWQLERSSACPPHFQEMC